MPTFAPALKILRGTKIVRSMSATPNRDNSSAGGGGSGNFGGKPTADGAGSSSRERADRSSIRSSIVAHVPAEPLCSNPLKPCGACMEWLKKIAEVNPDFKVITFTDSTCSGVYIEDVAQIM